MPLTRIWNWLLTNYLYRFLRSQLPIHLFILNLRFLQFRFFYFGNGLARHLIPSIESSALRRLRLPECNSIHITDANTAIICTHAQTASTEERIMKCKYTLTLWKDRFKIALNVLKRAKFSWKKPDCIHAHLSYISKCFVVCVLLVFFLRVLAAICNSALRKKYTTLKVYTQNAFGFPNSLSRITRWKISINKPSLRDRNDSNASFYLVSPNRTIENSEKWYKKAPFFSRFSNDQLSLQVRS